MRVLLTTRGSSGHMGPMVPFAQALLRAGHDVTVAAQRQHGANVERAGLVLESVDDPPEEEWMPLMGQFAELDVAAAHEVMIRDFFAGVDVRAALPGLNQIVARCEPDLILRESWEFASSLVAEQAGIPIARVGLGLTEVEEESIVLAAPAVDAAGVRLGLASDPEGRRLRAAPYLTAMPEALESPTATSPETIHRFGLSTPASSHSLPDWWGGNDDPIVLLTFGSVAAGGHLPYYPGFYRTAIDALAPLPIRLLVTIGDPTREISELGEVPDNVHVETWVPHDDAASAAAVIVCHGGYGSILGSLAHRVPMVVVPLFSGDQWSNAAAVARVGAGIALDGDASARPVLGLPGPETTGGLPGAVERLLEQASYRDGASRIADAIKALPPMDTAVGVLEKIAGGGR